MEVDLFVPCLVDQYYPQIAFNAIKLLEDNGYKVHYNIAQTCCGKTAFKQGFWDEAKELGVKFIEKFSNDRPIIGLSTSCVSMIKYHYVELFHNSALHNEYKSIKRNIYDLSDYMCNYIKLDTNGLSFPHKVAIHTSGSGTKEYKLKDEIKKLFQPMEGIEIVSLKHPDECCGYGEQFSVLEHELSAELTKNKVMDAIDSGAEYLAFTDISSMMNCDSYVKKNNLSLKCVYFADILIQETKKRDE